MQTIKIKIARSCGQEVDVEESELRRVIKENPELLTEENLPFVERMIGKEYWYIDAEGRKHKSSWCNDVTDNKILSINNAFFTESDCDKEMTKRKALGNIMSYIRDNEIELVKDEDWRNTDILKFTIEGIDDDNVIITDSSYCVYQTFKFDEAFYSQEDREKIISNCAKDLKTLLKK